MPVLLTSVADELARSVCASIWAAASDLEALGSGKEGEPRLELLRAAQARLVSTHPELIVREIARKKKVTSRATGKRNSGRRNWRPTRPQLAMAAADLMGKESVVAKAPLEKLQGCRFPYKIFANSLARELSTTPEASGSSHSSLVHAVTEVVTAVFAEAATLSSIDEGDLDVELHGSTDASWRGTTARGAGIAMTEGGCSLVARAASNVANRLASMPAPGSGGNISHTCPPTR